jgi:hypothetical protein
LQTQKSQALTQTQQYTTDAIQAIGQQINALSQSVTEFISIQAYELDKMTVQVESVTQVRSRALSPPSLPHTHTHLGMNLIFMHDVFSSFDCVLLHSA